MSLDAGATARDKAGASSGWTVMEVCGGQTHAILRWGLDQRLPLGMRLIHGPGCPVCVTPTEILQTAQVLAASPGVILCTYGDMLRVPVPIPGDPEHASCDLLSLRAAGADVRLITEPLQALTLALHNPTRPVVFLAVGFETTAPATALLARRLLDLQLSNLHLLVAHVRVVPAMASLLEEPGAELDAFLAPGQVCSVIGLEEVRQLAEEYRRPMVVAGFEPGPLQEALTCTAQMLERGVHGALNAYPQVVREDGNPIARALLAEVFEPVDLAWRGLGLIPGGGLALKGPYARFDARFSLAEMDLGAALSGSRKAGLSDWSAPQPGEQERSEPGSDPSSKPGSSDHSAGHGCIAAAVLQARALPHDCPCFGTSCTPDHLLGAPMVSEEGACGAWMHYRRRA